MAGASDQGMDATGSRRAILPANVDSFSSGEGPAVATIPDGRPVVSASRLIAALGLVFAVIAVFLPLPLHRPAWIDAEVVLAAWWVLGAVALTGMLFVGVGLKDDLNTPRRSTADESDQWWYHLSQLDFSHFGEADWLGLESGGPVMAVVVLVLLGVFILVGFVLIEVVLPLLLPLSYGLALWLLGRVLHGHQTCSGRLARSLALGVWWATVYTAPLALAVAVVHLLL